MVMADCPKQSLDESMDRAHGVHMTSTAVQSNFFASVVAATDEAAIYRVAEQVAKLDGFSLTGRVAVKSAKHMHRTVEIAMEPGSDRNDAWVVLSSYGINPEKELGSVWQTVPGVGLFD